MVGSNFGKICIVFFIANAEQTTDLKVLQLAMISRHGASLIIHGKGAVGEGPSRPIHS